MNLVNEIKINGGEFISKNNKRLNKYIEKDSNYIKNIEVNYHIKVEFKSDENISMNKMNVPNKVEYIKGD